MAAVTIIGSGLAGLSCARTLAQLNLTCNLVSNYNSERAQSVLAEGGINAALDTMGEGDTTDLHFEETMKAGAYLADPNAVKNLTENAPNTVMDLAALGVPFDKSGGKLILRSFGGQSKKRTAYAKSSTGKQLMSALIDEVRRFEAEGLVKRYAHHEMERIVKDAEDPAVCRGVTVRDLYTGKTLFFKAPVVLCMGGLGGLFPEMTTGTAANNCDSSGELFLDGVEFGNLEMIQYHPTTFKIPSKLCLISEAARGEGGRLFALSRNDDKRDETGRRYFMEEKYPKLGNLMPRDIVSREEYFILNDPKNPSSIYLDMTSIPNEAWKKMSDMRSEILDYTGKDPKTEAIEVNPGIHYFMGGIHVNERHLTNIAGLYAAGECCDQYHGANRLGGNSLLGAVFGGRTAALSAAEAAGAETADKTETDIAAENTESAGEAFVSEKLILEVGEILSSCMGIVRDGEKIEEGISKLRSLKDSSTLNRKELGRVLLAEAMAASADFRKESRGAHYRSDFPEADETYKKTQIASYKDGAAVITQRDIPEKRN